MSQGLKVSLCMPTNGVVEWVFPVLESIYNQGVDETLFEVVITDNGHNEDFKSQIREFILKHQNIVYAETNALPFINEIESYKRARGELIKFVNHRTKLVKGSLNKLIEFVEEYRDEKPVVYYSNGVLNILKSKHEYGSFDQFVKHLSYWSSWSTGMTIWKDDFEKLSDDVSEYNELFPHTNILFAERTRGKYIIDNSVIFDEIPVGHANKGKYNVFYAFGVEYPAIICDLLRDGAISEKTFLSVKNDNLKFISKMYLDFLVLRHKCSYDLSNRKESLEVFYSYGKAKRMAFVLLVLSVLEIPLRIIKKIIRIMGCFKKKDSISL